MIVLLISFNRDWDASSWVVIGFLNLLNADFALRFGRLVLCSRLLWRFLLLILMQGRNFEVLHGSRLRDAWIQIDAGLGLVWLLRSHICVALVSIFQGQAACNHGFMFLYRHIYMSFCDFLRRLFTMYKILVLHIEADLRLITILKLLLVDSIGAIK